jgi:hypothetical protein
LETWKQQFTRGPLSGGRVLRREEGGEEDGLA